MSQMVPAQSGNGNAAMAHLKRSTRRGIRFFFQWVVSEFSYRLHFPHSS